jgi:capsular exopolysaccharide synthesis family protein
MERIVKVAEQNPSIGIVRDVEAAAPLSAVRHGQEISVTYTQTRTVQIPPHVLECNRIVSGLSDPAITGAYKMLRTQVLQRMRAHGWSTLAVTSPGGGEGKSLTAINLAISLAKEVNHTVLLVDLDLRRPSIARHFGYEPAYGLRDYLLDDVPLTEMLFTPGVDRLVVLPGGQPLAESSELLTTPRMIRLAHELKDRYARRTVIYDMPPLLLADDMLAFSGNVDASLVVIQAGKTRKAEVQRAMDMLQGLNVVGTVLNDAQDAAHEYY